MLTVILFPVSLSSKQQKDFKRTRIIYFDRLGAESWMLITRMRHSNTNSSQCEWNFKPPVWVFFYYFVFSAILQLRSLLQSVNNPPAVFCDLCNRSSQAGPVLECLSWIEATDKTFLVRLFNMSKWAHLPLTGGLATCLWLLKRQTAQVPSVWQTAGLLVHCRALTCHYLYVVAALWAVTNIQCCTV